MPLGKLSFLHTLFLDNESQIIKINYRTMLFMSNQFSLPNISSIMQKMKIGQETDIRCFCMEAFHYMHAIGSQ